LWHCDWEDLTPKLRTLLRDHSLFPEVLISIIINYCAWIPWSGKKCQEIKIRDSWKMTTDQKYLYVCQWSDCCVSRYTLDTLQFIDKFTLESYGGTADIYGNELYIYDFTTLKVFNIITKDLIRQWTPPSATWAIKIYQENLYYFTFS